MNLAGLDAVQLSEVFRNWGIVAAGVFGLGIAVWRGLSMSQQAAAARDQARTADRDFVTDIFSRAVGQLGDDRLEIRLGAIYTLRQIKDDYTEFSRPVMMVLAAYVRKRTATIPDAAKEDDIREIVDLLGRALHKEEF